jgi:hypothetical protein
MIYKNNLWLSKNEILNKCQSKKVLFWGSGAWVEKSIKNLKLEPKYIVDNNKNIQGHKQRDVDIIDYESVENNIKDYYIIITTGSYKSLIGDLISKGLVEGEDFACSPVLNNLRIRDEMLSVDKNVLFSVPAPAKDGGGLYIYNTKSRDYNRIYEGKSRALYRSQNYIVLVDEVNGVVIFDKELNILKQIELLSNSVPHGITISEKSGLIFVANSGRDSISIFDFDSNEHLEEIKLSDKYDRLHEEHHHINDLYIDEEAQTLFVSMFSFTGNWRKNIYDGGVLEYDLVAKKFVGPIIEDMWMPHSIQVIGDSMVLLDSMRGDLYKTNNKIIGKFQGFVRGLDYDNQFFYVAQSAHRYFDRLKEVSLNIPLNCGIHIFDENTKASVFHSLPEIENIHSILLVGQEKFCY